MSSSVADVLNNGHIISLFSNELDTIIFLVFFTSNFPFLLLLFLLFMDILPGMNFFVDLFFREKFHFCLEMNLPIRGIARKDSRAKRI